MRLHTLTIVGVGLIGGSIGLAAKRRGVAGHVLGVGRNRAGLERAKALDAIDEAFTDIRAAARRAEMVVFCTPVDWIADQILEAAPACAAGTLLTDAGSTKSLIMSKVEGCLLPGIAFVGSHPLAGSEKRGSDHADGDLFQDRLTVVTPTPRTDPEALAKVLAFWQALGSRVRVMDPEEHDRALALTSHLPHLAASALAGILPEALYDLTATGFRDTTRVAAGDPSIWTGIFAQNRSAVLEALGALQDRVSEFKQAIIRNDRAALDALLTQAKKVRDALGS